MATNLTSGRMKRTVPRKKPLGVGASAVSIVAAALLMIFICPARAEADGGEPTIAELKQLNVEDLMNVEVTSVSRRPERLLDAASAIQVITQEDIRRSGATSIPEALRLADNLQVAQKNAHDWAISARGFNTALGNIKAAIVGTYRPIDQKHVPRYLAEFEYRFNRRYDLGAMMPRLTWAGVRTTPMPYRLLKSADVYT